MTPDLIGQRFGRLTVLSRHPDPTAAKKARWICACSCGNECIAVTGSLRSGHTVSCGCAKKQRLDSGDTNRTHGMSRTPEYRRWKAMIARCCRPTYSDYSRYGGRGISVCDRWRSSFPNFLADMGPLPSPIHSIERRDANGNYEPTNCYWATPSEQARNKRRTLRFTYQGETLPLPVWCERLEVEYNLVYNRIRVSGWSFERAVTTPKLNQVLR